jgi:MFS family permease
MATTSSPTDKKPVFYGWYVVAAAFFMAFMVVGSRQSIGLFIDVWAEEFEVSIALISGAISIGFIVNGLAHPIMGKLTDKFGGRKVMAISMLGLGLTTGLLAMVPNVYVLMGVYGFLVSFAMAGVLFTPITSVASRWFRKKRGTAMGLLAAGGSAGGMLLVPFLAYIMLLTDWRITLGVVAAVMSLLAFPVLALVVRNDPKELGLQPDGETDADGGAARQAAIRIGPLANDDCWQCSFRSAPMWQMMLSYVVCGVTTGVIGVHFVPFAVNEGIDKGTAALAFGLLSGVNLIGVAVAGALSDKLHRKDVLAAVYFIRAVAFGCLAFLPASIGLWFFAGIAGVSWLATVPLTSSLVSEVYGVKNVGVLAGVLTMAHQFGGAGAVFIAGLIFTATGSYTPIFIASIALLIGAGVLSFMVRERAYSSRFQPALPTPETA